MQKLDRKEQKNSRKKQKQFSWKHLNTCFNGYLKLGYFY